MYVTFLPYALERRVSGEDRAVDIGSILFQWFCYSAKQSSFFSSLELTLLHRQKKSIPIRFFLGHCGTISMAPVARG